MLSDAEENKVKRYFIGSNGQRVTVEGTSDRAEKLVAWMLERGYAEVSESEYLTRNVKRNELVAYDRQADSS